MFRVIKSLIFKTLLSEGVHENVPKRVQCVII